MALFSTIYQQRTADEVVTFYDADGNEIAMAGSDKVRIKIGIPGRTPVLDIVSGTPTANGSTASAANPSDVHFDQSDTNTTPGVYEIEASIVDGGTGKIKHAESGVLQIIETQDGGVS